MTLIVQGFLKSFIIMLFNVFMSDWQTDSRVVLNLLI